MGDCVGDQRLLVKTEQENGDLHSCVAAAFLESLEGSLCFIARVLIKNKDHASLLRLRAPLLFAYHAMIKELEIHRVILKV